jgi:hypothetical protein
MTSLRVPTSLGRRCKLGVIMHNFMGYWHQVDLVAKAIAAIPMREVEINGDKYMQVEQLDMEARS